MYARRVHILFTACALGTIAACFSGTLAVAQHAELTNPYQHVDWATYSHFRADLHLHTIQSDGCHHVEEVIRVFQQAGFSILSITDHDSVAPNLCRTRDNSTPRAIAAGAYTDRPTPYPDPHPENYPANTTWPWNEFGSSSPQELGILGIEGVELTCGHHRSAFFVDYGVALPCAPSINEQLRDVERLGGLAFINHPEPRFREWYYELYRDHAASYLVGLEISRNVDASSAIWDQLLADLMPSRPVWGFATSDTHFLAETPFSFTVFLLDELVMEGAKEAMRAGQFYSVVGPGTMDLRESGRAPYDGTYPQLRSVSVDLEAANISIDAANFDEILWITGRSTAQYTLDPETGVSWPPGEIIHRGPVFSYSSVDPDLRYVRVELISHSESGPIRVLLNPFGFASLSR